VKRVAIVTGAAKPDSIGFAVAQGLIEEGCEVVVADLYTEGFSAFRGLCV
jgi:NAD(P)-dependent dehydrogenase (short-subunit alcohol dehydrogenase family)